MQYILLVHLVGTLNENSDERISLFYYLALNKDVQNYIHKLNNQYNIILKNTYVAVIEIFLS